MNNALIISESGIIGGAEIVLKDYLEATDKANHIYIIAKKKREILNFYRLLPVKKVYASYFLSSGSYYMNIIIKPFLFLLFSIQVIPIIIRKDIKCIVANNTREMFYLLFIKLFFPKIRFYAYIHDMVKISKFRRELFSFFSQNILDNFISVSTAVKNRLMTFSIGESKIELIFNGLKKNNISAKEISIPLKFLFVGRMEERKNPMEYIHFLSELKKRNIHFQATLIYTAMDHYLLNKIKEEIDHKNLKIELNENLERHIVFQKMRNNSFLFICSKRDPLPTVVLEAFNCGTPVIGKKVDGIPDMIRNEYNGYLYDDSQGFQSIIERLKKIDQKEYYRLSTNALETIDSKFKIEYKVEKLDKLLFC